MMNNGDLNFPDLSPLVPDFSVLDDINFSGPEISDFPGPEDIDFPDQGVLDFSTNARDEIAKLENLSMPVMPTVDLEQEKNLPPEWLDVITPEERQNLESNALMIGRNDRELERITASNRSELLNRLEIDVETHGNPNVTVDVKVVLVTPTSELIQPRDFNLQRDYHKEMVEQMDSLPPAQELADPSLFDDTRKRDRREERGR